MKREIWFRILMLALPLVALIALESILALFGWFEQPPLYRQMQKNGTIYYQLNSEVARRYFDEKRMAVPNLYPAVLPAVKNKSTYRILCLGGSSTAGFPFDYQIPFPFQLQKILQKVYPDTRFEVINLGISAVNSYTVLDFMPEALQLQPDLIILYMGHNEFYGAYGAASATSLGYRGGLIRFYLKIKKFHIVQMLKSLVGILTPGDEIRSGQQTLMEQMVGENEILRDSPLFKETVRNYYENLGEILEMCRSNGVPVMAGELVSNLKDQLPLCAIIARTKNQNAGKEISTSISSYKKARSQMTSGANDSALFNFIRARDLDVIRFRAPSEINRILHRYSGRGLTIIPLDSVFRVHSENGIPGNELFTDHLHPTPHGYYLMARAFAQAIQIPDKTPHGENAPTDVAFITDLDLEMGLINIDKLKHRWPFANKPYHFAEYEPHGDSAAARIAYQFLSEHHNWYKAHYDLAKLYMNRDSIARAIDEYQAVHYYYPLLADPLYRIGICLGKQNNWSGAEFYYRQALSKSKNKAPVYQSLAVAQWRQKKMVQAVNNIQFAIKGFDNNLPRQAEAKLTLAKILLDMNRRRDARMVLRELLNRSPEYQPAREFLKKLPE